MRNPRSYIEKFCYKYPNFGFNNLMKYVTVANVVFWLISMINPVLLSYLSFNPQLILRGQVWRLLSFAFYPPASGLWAALMFYFYYWIGSTLEREWGTPQFNVFYFSGIILTAIFGFIIYFITGINLSINASYIYLSMFLSFAVLFPDMQVLLFFVIPVKMKYLAYVDAAIFVFGVVTTPFPANLLPVVAVLNFLIFCGGDLLAILPRKPSQTTVNFRREARKVNRQPVDITSHVCAVCGKSDRDHPELEFRYCSRCAGYHCFCQDHINNHIHFTQ